MEYYEKKEKQVELQRKIQVFWSFLSFLNPNSALKHAKPWPPAMPESAGRACEAGAGRGAGQSVQNFGRHSPLSGHPEGTHHAGSLFAF